MCFASYYGLAKRKQFARKVAFHVYFGSCDGIIQAYEILHQARVPIHNVAEVLVLLREGGMLLRGEELNLVKRGAFRSAVLQKIHSVISGGVTEFSKNA